MKARLSLSLALLLLGVAHAQPADDAAQGVTLAQALEAALKNHPDRAAAAARLAATRERVTAAEAALRPQLSANARAGLSNQYPANAMQAATQDSYAASLSAGLTLWDFGRNDLTVEAAKRRVQASEADQKTASQRLAQEVYLAYLSALEGQAQLELAQITQENRVAHLAETDALVVVGRRTSVDVAKLRARLAEADSDLIATEASRDSARLRLAQAMGTTGMATPAAAELELLSQKLIAQAGPRPQILALEASLEAQIKSAEAAAAWQRPTLDLSLSTGASQAGEADLALNTQAMLSLSFKFYDGHQSDAQAAAAAAEVRAAQAELATARLGVSQEVESAQLSLKTARAQVKATEALATEASTALELSLARFKEGLGSALELADAELALQSAKARQIQARYAALKAQVALAVAQGALPEAL